MFEHVSTVINCLPFQALPKPFQDVLTFFAQHNVADTIHDGPNSAKLLPKANGRPSGQAVVQMRSRRDADVAQKALNHQYVGGRYIEARGRAAAQGLGGPIWGHALGEIQCHDSYGWLGTVCQLGLPCCVTICGLFWVSRG